MQTERDLNGYSFLVVFELAVTDELTRAGFSVGNIHLYGGTQELISGGTLALTYGTHYGLVGRNGVGKTSLLRAIATKAIVLPDFLHIIHVEQECHGDERTALETILQVCVLPTFPFHLKKALLHKP